MSIVKKKLQKRFKMTDMGPASLVLGMEIKKDCEQGTLTISQEAYSKSILERFEMSDCKPTSTPGYGLELSNNQQRTLRWTRRKRDVIRAWWGACCTSFKC